ncbi:uncharacterized protein LOC117320858 [Pecten maximus]|uniref:uncharacterized protein LOC117320858 n=1 Tax=Pecten maximus TaxID=6579 RepID=UPI00145910EB|nr:uncharacterized protein LOC117320858 [Pecten maximus]
MAKRPRVKNFDNDELELLTQLCEQHKDILNSKLTNSKTNEDKKKIWIMMAAEISALGKSKRTAECVKTKWANTASEAKRNFSDMQIYKRGTGGGPPPKLLTPLMEKVVDLYKDSAAFTGLEGVEVPPPPSDLRSQRVSTK